MWRLYTRDSHFRLLILLISPHFKILGTYWNLFQDFLVIIESKHLIYKIFIHSFSYPTIKPTITKQIKPNPNRMKLIASSKM